MGGLALGMAFLLSACGEDNAYTNALPKDAAAVFSFDLMEMAQKCDLNDQVKQSMGQMMKSSLKGSADALVDKLMENPEESGLRLTDRVYFFCRFSDGNGRRAGAHGRQGKTGRFDGHASGAEGV